MAKKLVASIAVLAALIVLSIIVMQKARPSVENRNLIEKARPEAISRIRMSDSGGVIVLEKKDKNWMVMEPINDSADDVNIEPIVSALAGSKAGSIVSQNPAHFADYGVESDKSVRVQAFADGEKPVLDGYVGKQGANFTDSYFRFEGDNRVYDVKNLPAFMFRQTADAYRLHRLFRRDINDAVAISITAGKTSVAVEQSSDVWKNTKTNTVVPSAWVSSLKENMQGLVLTSFVLDPKAATGFDKPGVTIIVTWPGGTKSAAVIGNQVLAPSPGRCAKADDHLSTFLLDSNAVKKLQDFLKTAPPKA
jgi:hypothetical protein